MDMDNMERRVSEPRMVSNNCKMVFIFQLQRSQAERFHIVFRKIGFQHIIIEDKTCLFIQQESDSQLILKKFGCIFHYVFGHLGQR
jgi:hypothetical protein